MASFDSLAFDTDAFDINSFFFDDVVPPEPEPESTSRVGGGKRRSQKYGWLKFVSNAELEELKRAPEYETEYNTPYEAIAAEDKEITEFLMTILTKGLI